MRGWGWGGRIENPGHQPRFLKLLIHHLCEARSLGDTLSRKPSRSSVTASQADGPSVHGHSASRVTGSGSRRGLQYWIVRWWCGVRGQDLLVKISDRWLVVPSFPEELTSAVPFPVCYFGGTRNEQGTHVLPKPPSARSALSTSR